MFEQGHITRNAQSEIEYLRQAWLQVRKDWVAANKPWYGNICMRMIRALQAYNLALRASIGRSNAGRNN